jgi:hypothetical protein
VYYEHLEIIDTINAELDAALKRIRLRWKNAEIRAKHLPYIANCKANKKPAEGLRRQARGSGRADGPSGVV